MTELEAKIEYLSQALKRYEAENFGLEYCLKMETERRVKAENELKKIKNRINLIQKSAREHKFKLLSNLNQELQ